jgi:hypothetical protein
MTHVIFPQSKSKENEWQANIVTHDVVLPVKTLQAKHDDHQ